MNPLSSTETRQPLQILPEQRKLPELTPHTMSSGLIRMINTHGTNALRTHPRCTPSLLNVAKEVPVSLDKDQKSSGRCWIFALVHMLSAKLTDTYGKDFTLSENWIAYWDRLERANIVLNKMIKYRDLNPMHPKMVYYLRKYFEEGGEFEFCKNVIEKYGIVPDYAMPETKLSGESSGYTGELQAKLNEGAGVLHKMAKEGKSLEELLEIKELILKGIRNLLVCYLGEPPKEFLIKQVNKKSGLDDSNPAAPQTKTPLAFYKECGVDLNDYVHLSNLPYLPMDQVISVRGGKNVYGKKRIQTLNLSMERVLKLIREAINLKVSVPFTAEVKQLDREHALFSTEVQDTGSIAEFPSMVSLEKGDRLLYRSTVLAHLMNIVGCDGEDDKSKPDYDLKGRLFKVQNSWKDLHTIYATEDWIKTYGYLFLVPATLLSEDEKTLWDQREKRFVVVERHDPLGWV